MRDYGALEALAAQNPRMNDMRITTPKGTLSMRSDFGLWLKRGSPQIGKPETDSMLVEVPGADWAWQLDVEMTPGEYKTSVKITATCDPWPKERYFVLGVSKLGTDKIA